MLIYSQTILKFLETAVKLTQNIFKDEMRLSFSGKRLLFQNYYYPLEFSIFDERKELAIFNSDFYEISLNRSLIYLANKETLKNILRHEIAHFMEYILYKSLSGHSNRYREICLKYRWGKKVYAASFDIESAQSEIPQGVENIVSKIKKLMALSQSTNNHEAETATVLANKLILKHQLDHFKEFINERDKDLFYMERILHSKKRTAKTIPIFEILKTFFVVPVLNHGPSRLCISISGRKDNVCVASYVADFLNYKLDELYYEFKAKNPHIKGNVQSSFMQGIATGYVKKIKDAQKEYLGPDSKALRLIEDELAVYKDTIYPSLRSKSISSSNKVSGAALYARKKGLETGKNLNIHSSVSQKRKQGGVLQIHYLK